MGGAAVVDAIVGVVVGVGIVGFMYDGGDPGICAQRTFLYRLGAATADLDTDSKEIDRCHRTTINSS